jgi:hypothetical protein
MPDLNHSTQEIMVWPDEMCAACKVFPCPLKECIRTHEIEFVSGCRVWECKLYDPDTESEHYIPEIGSPDRIDRLVEQSIKALTKQIEYLLKRANECP